MPTASRQVMQIDSNDPSGPFTCLNWDSVAILHFTSPPTLPGAPSFSPFLRKGGEATSLRCDLEHHARLTVGDDAARRSCSIEIASTIEDHSSLRRAAIHGP